MTPLNVYEAVEMRRVRTTLQSRQAKRDPTFVGPLRPVGRGRNRRGEERKDCAHCGKQFARLAGISNADWESRRFCSLPCGHKGHWASRLPSKQPRVSCSLRSGRGQHPSDPLSP